MMSTNVPSRFFGSLVLLLVAALAGCPSNDNNLGSDDGGRTVTCEEGAKTYRPGETIVRSACTTCVCLADGTIGQCTGLCVPDAAAPADATVTCEQNGITYQVGETVVLSACTSCVCQADGKVGLCTGACPPDAGAVATCRQNGTTYLVGQTVVLSACTSCICQSDGSLGLCTGLCSVDAGTDSAALCTDTGGTVAPQLCCLSVSDFPNLCLVGACGCSPSGSHNVKVCTCPAGTCFDPTRGCTAQQP